MILIVLIALVIYSIIGIVQPISAIGRLSSIKRRDSKFAILLKRYLFTVGVYYMILLIRISFFSEKHFSTDLALIYLFVVPFLFAVWYKVIVKIGENQIKNIAAFDQMRALHQDRLLLESYPSKKIKLTKSAIKRNTLELPQKQAVIRKLKLPLYTS